MNMNSRRTNFTLPISHIKITKYWLLGFVEGDGSFTSGSYKSLKGRPLFIITQKNTSNLTLDRITKFFNIGRIKIDKKGISYLWISDIKSLYNIIYPFFNELHFFTTKGLDFLHWSYLVKFHFNGLHLRNDIKEIIDYILKNMNYYRVSTNIIKYNLTQITLDYNQLNQLLTLPPIYTEKTRLRKSTGIISSKPVYVYNQNKVLIDFYPSIREVARIFSLPKTSIILKLDTGILYKSYYFYSNPL